MNPAHDARTAARAPRRTDDRVEAMRSFNRFYTRRIGVLRERLGGSPYTLAESRLLWELGHHDGGVTAAELARELDLDPGYLSRTLRNLRAAGLLDAVRSSRDARQTLLTLTPQGRAALQPLEARARHDMAALLAPLSESQQQRLLGAMSAIGTLLDPAAPRDAPIRLRAPQPGDIGWVVSRHGELYAREFGWSLDFEALVARIAADFVDRLDPACEAGWIAVRGDERLGCVFLVRARDEAGGAVEPGTAQLRMLLVEPDARGSGLGRRLVARCTAYAREAGYRRIRLWTQASLLAARAIYTREGYRLVAEQPHHHFGHDLVGEIWELDLAPAA